jgi:hypothetical protein
MYKAHTHTILNFTENSVKMTKTDYDPDRSLVLIEGLSHFVTNFLQNLASCQTALKHDSVCQFVPKKNLRLNFEIIM